MFVERLSKKQLWEYIKTIPGYDFVKESDISFSKFLTNGFIVISVNLPDNTKKLINVTDNYFFSSHDDSWKEKLYSIFGDEYKNWYTKQINTKPRYKSVFC